MKMMLVILAITCANMPNVFGMNVKLTALKGGSWAGKFDKKYNEITFDDKDNGQISNALKEADNTMSITFTAPLKEVILRPAFQQGSSVLAFFKKVSISTKDEEVTLTGFFNPLENTIIANVRENLVEPLTKAVEKNNVLSLSMKTIGGSEEYTLTNVTLQDTGVTGTTKREVQYKEYKIKYENIKSDEKLPAAINKSD